MAIESISDMTCFPRGCMLDMDLQLAMVPIFIPQLEEIGMTLVDWTRGAMMHEEPQFSKLKSVVCKTCNIRKCPSNPHFMPSGGLNDLMIGRLGDRLEKAEQIFAQLLPEVMKTELEQNEIEVNTRHIHSKKNPVLMVWFTRKGEMHYVSYVSYEVGNHLLRTDENKEGEETLLSLEQLGQKVKEAIHAFT